MSNYLNVFSINSVPEQNIKYKFGKDFNGVFSTKNDDNPAVHCFVGAKFIKLLPASSFLTNNDNSLSIAISDFNSGMNLFLNIYKSLLNSKIYPDMKKTHLTKIIRLLVHQFGLIMSS